MLSEFSRLMAVTLVMLSLEALAGSVACGFGLIPSLDAPLFNWSDSRRFSFEDVGRLSVSAFGLFDAATALGPIVAGTTPGGRRPILRYGNQKSTRLHF